MRQPCPPSPPPPPPYGRSPRYQAPNVPRKAPSAQWIVTALLGFVAGVLTTLAATGLL